MCGLVGSIAKYSGGFSVVALKAFEDLLYMDTLRGPDSTGVMLVTKDGEVTITKEIGEAIYTLYDPDYQKKINTPAYKEGKILMGHNRKATVGKVTIDNAHPFVVKDELVLAHNGSLTTHKHLGDTEVDSHAIAQYIHEHWKDDAEPVTYTKMLQHIGGAFALTWYDLRTGRLNIVRNNQRPLYIAETDSNFFWASEKSMLIAALERNNITIKSCVQVETTKLYYFDICEQVSTYDVKMMEVVLPTVPFPVITNKKGKVPHIPYNKTPVASGLLGTTTMECMGGAANDDVYTDELSKAKFRRYIKELVGKTISFQVEDFVTTTDPSKEWFYGTNPDYGFNHEVIGTISTTLAEEVMKDNMMAAATITHASYIKHERKVCLTVKVLGSSTPVILTH